MISNTKRKRDNENKYNNIMHMPGSMKIFTIVGFVVIEILVFNKDMKNMAKQ